MNQLFLNCFYTKYIHTYIGGSYALVPKDDVLYIYFDGSDGLPDWIYNFLFFQKKRKPYNEMDIPWKCHGGFLAIWDSIKSFVKDEILNSKYKNIIIVGYSHGGAIASLCHEYVWFNRPDLRDVIEGYGFGAPRVFSGKLTDELSKRWERFTVIRNLNDLVTHAPPSIFGFKHVGKILEIGKKHQYNCIVAHYPDSYYNSLLEFKNNVKL